MPDSYLEESVIDMLACRWQGYKTIVLGRLNKLECLPFASIFSPA